MTLAWRDLPKGRFPWLMRRADGHREDEVRHYTGRVASLEGMFVCPEGAATPAALKKLLHAGDPVA